MDDGHRRSRRVERPAGDAAAGRGLAVRDRAAHRLRRARGGADGAEPAATWSLLTFLYAGLALAWNIAGGYAGLISFGHAAFFGIGAYTSTILFVRGGVTPWIGLWIGALTCAVAGAVLAVICARLRGRSSSCRRSRPPRWCASAR